VPILRLYLVASAIQIVGDVCADRSAVSSFVSPRPVRIVLALLLTIADPPLLDRIVSARSRTPRYSAADGPVALHFALV